jgi:glutathione S-transferase
MAKIEHRVGVPNMSRSPKGKIPYVDLDGRLIGDSQLIIEALKAKHGDVMDGWLDEHGRAKAHVVRRTLEEGYYFAVLVLRWMDEEGFRAYMPEFKKVLPPALRPLLPALIRRSARKTAIAQGTGRHALEDVARFAMADLDAVSTLLGDGPYLCGDRPCTADATLYAMVDGTWSFPLDTALRRHLGTKPNLLAHRTRVREAYFPELEDTTKGRSSAMAD